MDIKNCPECGDDAIDAGLAMWPGVDGPVDIVRCASDECDWVTIDESLEIVVAAEHDLAA